MLIESLARVESLADSLNSLFNFETDSLSEYASLSTFSALVNSFLLLL